MWGVDTMLDNFGFIREQLEVKLLILFIMRRLSKPVSHEILTGLALCDDGISYFDVIECLANLVETQHIAFENNEYSLLPKGERNGEVLEKNLPYSVRARAEAATTIARVNINRDSMIKTESEAIGDGGYKVSFSLSDGVGDIIAVELFAANEKQANTFEKNFRNNAEKMYHAFVKILVE